MMTQPVTTLFLCLTPGWRLLRYICLFDSQSLVLVNVIEILLWYMLM